MKLYFYLTYLALFILILSTLLQKIPEESYFDAKVAVYNAIKVRVFKNLFQVVTQLLYISGVTDNFISAIHLLMNGSACAHRCIQNTVKRVVWSLPRK